jgi:hypothetical protein
MVCVRKIVLKTRDFSLGDWVTVLYPQVSLIINRNSCLAGLLFSAQCALHPWSCVEAWEYGFPLWPCAMKPLSLNYFKGCLSLFFIPLYNLFPYNSTFSIH